MYMLPYDNQIRLKFHQQIKYQKFGTTSQLPKAQDFEETIIEMKFILIIGSMQDLIGHAIFEE